MSQGGDALSQTVSFLRSDVGDSASNCSVRSVSGLPECGRRLSAPIPADCTEGGRAPFLSEASDHDLLSSVFCLLSVVCGQGFETSDKKSRIAWLNAAGCSRWTMWLAPAISTLRAPWISLVRESAMP